MKKLKSILIALIVLMATPAHSDVLLWFVNDPDIYDYYDGEKHKVDTIVGRGDAEGMTINAVRVSMTTTDSSGESTTSYLQLNTGFTHNFDHAVQSIAIPDDFGENAAGPASAQIIGIDDALSITFAIELGHLNDNSEDWTILAIASETYEKLSSNNHIVSDQLGMQGKWWWTPTFTVPEPDGIPMWLIGFSILFLQRKPRLMD